MDAESKKSARKKTNHWKVDSFFFIVVRNKRTEFCCELSSCMVNYFFKFAGRECWYSIACFENCQMAWVVAPMR